MDYDKLFAIDRLQSKYGLKNIKPNDMGIQILNIKKSKSLKNKYDVVLITRDNIIKIIPFGDTDYDHFFDKIGDYSINNHFDIDRRKQYLARATRIKDNHGNYTLNNPLKSNYYAIRLLW